MKFLKECLLSTVVLLVTTWVVNAKEKLPCSTQFGQFPRLNNSTEDLIKAHLKASMQFLTIANHFGEWDLNRKGFQDYFNKLSDAAWEDAVALMQHMLKRGGRLSSKFGIPYEDDDIEIGKGMSELQALGKALDIAKKLAKKTLFLIVKSNHGPIIPPTTPSTSTTRATPTTSTTPTTPTTPNSEELTDIANWRTHGYQRDGEFAHFLADEVSDKQVPRIKNLANHANTLSKALKETSSDKDKGLVLYLYDTQIITE